jgi:signal recognition particle subunit SRP54
MMDEISRVHKAIQPHETLFVDAMTGQDAVNTAKAFDILNFDGVILTKLDGDTRGGFRLKL